MDFKVVKSRYDAEGRYLHFTASGTRDGMKFTVSSHVKVLKDPVTPENIHLVALLALTEIFKRRSASGR
jgi:hypothetical protein